MKIKIKHLYLGETRHVTEHEVTTVGGLIRVINSQWTEGWGAELVMSRDTLRRFGGMARPHEHWGMLELPLVPHPLLVTVED